MNLEGLRSDVKRVLENQQYVREKVRRIDHILTGNGDPEKGALFRLDRVYQSYLEMKEQETDRRKQMRRMFGAAALAVLGFCGSLTLLVIRLVWGV